MRTLLLITLCLSTLVGRSPAELVLDGKVIDVKPKPEDETISAIFTFSNKGAKTVKVVSVESKCSCLSATVDAASYAAGARGIGTAEFKVGSFVGKHEKFVVINTDDPAQPEWVVTFVLDVPEVIQIEPRTLQWWLNDSTDPKEATVKIVGKDPMKVTNVTATRDTVEVSWKEVKPGREYLVTVKPKLTKEVFLGALKIETDSKIPKYQRQLAFFSVYRKPDSVAVPSAPAPSPSR